MIKILIIGGTRFVGKRLALLFFERGMCEITLANRHGVALLNKNINHIFFDKNDLKTYVNLAHKKFDVLIDMISYSANDVRMMFNIFDYIQCDRYVMISSSVVYGWGKNHKEKDFMASRFAPLPYTIKELSEIYGYKQAYQLGKMSAESVVASECPVKSLVVRFPLIYGEFDHTKRMETFIENIYMRRGIYVDNLMSEFSMLEVSHAAKCIADLVKNNVDGVINIAEGGTINMMDIIRIIEKLLGKKAIFASDGVIGGYNGYYTSTFNLDRMKKLHMKLYDVREGLGKILNYLIKRSST